MSAEDRVETLDVYISFTQTAKELPSNREGKRVHVGTVHRYRYPGVVLPDGSRLRLKADRFPSGWMTTRRWIREFIDTLTAAHECEAVNPQPQPRTSATRRRAIERAESECQAAGL